MARSKALVLFAQIIAAAGSSFDGACAVPAAAAEQHDDPSLLQVHKPRGAVKDVKLPAKMFRSLHHDRLGECDLPTKECHLEGGEGCDLKDMTFHSVNKVYPAGQTACMNSDAPFWFAVKKGHPKKLLFVLEQGGACWDQASYQATEPAMCEKEPYLWPWSGVMNYSNWQNPYHRYTIIRVPVCSGDLHTGNTEQAWNLDGSMVQIRGYHNANSAVQWALKSFPHLDKLAFLGYSSGSLGLQYWADSLIQQFEDRKASVVVYSDSFAGVLFPVSPVLELFTYQVSHVEWNICNNGVLPPDAQASCEAATFTWQGYFKQTMAKHPTVLFASFQSKVDSEQIYFLNLVNLGVLGQGITAKQFYVETTLLYKDFAENPNFRAYLLNGGEHWLPTWTWFYTATPLGVDADNGVPTMLKWVRIAEGYCSKIGKPFPPHACIGDSVSVTSREQEVPEGETWCDATFLPESVEGKKSIERK